MTTATRAADEVLPELTESEMIAFTVELDNAKAVGQAFPGGYPPQGSPADAPAPTGMSLREWLTGMALQGLLANGEGPSALWIHDSPPNPVSEMAVSIADQTLAALSRKEGT